MTGPDTDEMPERPDADFLAYGPLTIDGERILAEIDGGAVDTLDTRSGIDPDDVRLLNCAVQSIADYRAQLTAAAAGQLDTLDTLRKRLSEPPGVQLWRNYAVFSGRMPVGPIYDGPCGVGPVDFGPLIMTGFALGGGVRDPTWVRRAFAEYAMFAGAVEHVLQGGRDWLNSGRREALRESFSALRRIGRGGERAIRFRCLDEQEVCLEEILNLDWENLGDPRPRFPSMGALTPTDVCIGYGGVITVSPAGVFRLPADVPGMFPIIDHEPADVISWTPFSIVLKMPAQINAGCHSVGWGYLMNADAILRIRAVAQQCMPWYPTGGLLRDFPVFSWRHLLDFSVIGQPAVTVDANGAASLAAEACVPVNLNWNVTQDACPETQAATQISLLRDNVMFRPTLAPSGRLVVSDAEDATYTVNAVSRLGGQICAANQRSVTITRQKKLRIAPFIDRCVDAESTVTLQVSISCPAPRGGLPVTVTSQHPSRIPSTQESIEEGYTSLSVDLTSGNQCGATRLTATAPGHTPAQITLIVVAVPQITAINPETVLTCEHVALIVTGSCLGDQDWVPQALLIADGAIQASVKVNTPQTELALSHPPMPAGSYIVALSNCGRVGYAPIPLQVTHQLPVITSPLVANATSVLLCATPTLTLSWRVRFTQILRLVRAGVIIAEREYDPCQEVSDSADDTLPTVSGGVSYTLVAINPNGEAVTETLSIPVGTLVPTCSRFVLTNNFTEAVNAFMVNGENQNGIFLGTFEPRDTAIVSLSECQIRAVRSINPRLVEEHNQRFPNNQFDPKAVSTALAFGATWHRNFSNWRLGRSSAGPQSMSL